MCFLFIVVGCQKQEEIIDIGQENKSEIIITGYTFRELVSNPVFQKTFFPKKNSKQKEKSSESLKRNFIIDSSRVTKVEIDGYVSCTMLINRPPFSKSGSFENLVIEKNRLNKINTYLIKYTPATKIEYIKEHNSYTFEGERSIALVDFDGYDFLFHKMADCGAGFETWCSWGGTEHVAGPMCYEANDGRLFKKYIENGNCTEEGGPDGGSGGGGSGSGDDFDTVITSPTFPDGTSAAPDFLINILSPLTTQQKFWIKKPYNLENVETLLNYVSSNGSSIEAKDFAREMVAAGTQGNLISISPFFQYPEGSNYATLYPKLTEYLKNQMPKVANMPSITDAIQDITGLSLSQIQDDLEWGKGPIIKIVQLDGYADNTDYKTVGTFDDKNPGILFLDIDWVNALENDISDQSFEDAYLFFLGVTVLHEYVHYGDYQNGNNYQFPKTAEEGNLFELQVYGKDIGPTTLIFNNK